MKTGGDGADRDNGGGQTDGRRSDGSDGMAMPMNARSAADAIDHRPRVVCIIYVVIYTHMYTTRARRSGVRKYGRARADRPHTHGNALVVRAARA